MSSVTCARFVLCWFLLLSLGLTVHAAETALVLVPPSGSYQTALPIFVLGGRQPGERLVYTLDGSAPTAASWRLPGSILLTDSTTVRVGAINAAGVLTRQVSGSYAITAALATARPTALPRGGTYQTPLQVALSTTTPGATIRYTTDGSDPTGGSVRYAAPILVNRSTTLRARAFGGTVQVRSGRLSLRLPAILPSGVMTANYTLQVAPPSLAAPAGTYSEPQTITATGTGTIRYTLNGLSPTAVSPELPSGFLLDHSATVTVAAFQAGWTPSSAVSAAYVLQVQPLVTSLPAGTYTGAQNVTLTCSTSGATITYTRDGSDPATSATGSSAIAAITVELRRQGLSCLCPEPVAVGSVFHLAFAREQLDVAPVLAICDRCSMQNDAAFEVRFKFVQEVDVPAVAPDQSS